MLPSFEQFVEKVIQILHEKSVFEYPEANKEPSNGWRAAFDAVYDREFGPARGFDLPQGRSALSNFKSKMLDLWRAIAQACRERPDGMPAPAYEDLAVADLATYMELKALKEKELREKKEKTDKMSRDMEDAEKKLGAVPPGIEESSRKQKRSNLAPMPNPALPQSAPTAAAASAPPVGFIQPTDLNYNPYSVAIDEGASKIVAGVNESIKNDFQALMKELTTPNDNSDKYKLLVMLQKTEKHKIDIGEDHEAITKRRRKLEEELLLKDE